MLKKIMVALALSVLLLLPTGVLLCTAVPAAIDGFESVFENAYLSLHLNRETGEISLIDKDSGALWHSCPTDRTEENVAKGIFKMSLFSLVTLQLIDMDTQTESMVTSYTESVLSDGASYDKIQNGFLVNLTFVDQRITVPLKISLEKDSLLVTVKSDGISETGNQKIKSIILLPYFGAGRSQNEGFLFVPDGSGAIINFNNNKTDAAFYDADIYGSDLSVVSTSNVKQVQNILLPVFGLQNGNNGFLAIVEGAEANASVKAEVSGKRTSYNTVFSYFKLRDSSTSKIGDKQVTSYEKKLKAVGDMSVRYYFYSNGGGYSQMSKLYRNYLISKGMTKTERNAGCYVNVLNSYSKKANFLGFSYQKEIALTTFDQTTEILKELENRDILSPTLILQNWNKNYSSGKLSQNTKFSSALGSLKDYNKLSSYAQSNGIPLFLNCNLTTFRKGDGLFSELFESARNINNIAIKRYDYMISTYYNDISSIPLQYLTLSKLDQKLTRFIKNFSKSRLLNITVSDMAKCVYSDYRKNSAYTKTAVVSEFENAFKKLENSNMNMLSDSANAYALPYLTDITSLPVTGSYFDIIDEAVPFYQITVSGLVNYSVPAVNLSSEPQKMFLKAMETGSSLYYVLAASGEALSGVNYSEYYSIAYQNLLNMIQMQNKGITELFTLIGDSAIDFHEKVSDDVYVTGYANGVKVYVNYSSTPFESDNGTVNSAGYLIVKGR